MSILIGPTVVVAVLPPLSMAVPETVMPLVSLVSVQVPVTLVPPAPGPPGADVPEVALPAHPEVAIPAVASEHVNVTTTLLVYQLLLPSVPLVIAPLMVGAVLSMTSELASVSEP